MESKHDEERRNLELAHARRHCEAVRAALDSHRSKTRVRGHDWKLGEARHLQQYEEAQARVMSLRSMTVQVARDHGKTPSALRAAARGLSRLTGSRWARWLGLRRAQAPPPASHTRGRG